MHGPIGGLTAAGGRHLLEPPPVSPPALRYAPSSPHRGDPTSARGEGEAKKAIKNNERTENGKGNPRDFHGNGPHRTGRPLIVRCASSFLGDRDDDLLLVDVEADVAHHTASSGTFSLRSLRHTKLLTSP